MKARLLRDSIVRNQRISKHERALIVEQYQAGKITRQQLVEALQEGAKKGTVIDHPRAFRLVQLGQAEPADAECKLAANMSDAAIARAMELQQRLQDAQALDPARNASAEGVKKTRERVKKAADKAAGKRK